MALSKTVSLVDNEVARARAQAIHDLEFVQKQIIGKINEIIAITDDLRRDVDDLQGNSHAKRH